MSNPFKTNQHALHFDLAHASSQVWLNTVVAGAIFVGILWLFFSLSIQSWDHLPVPASKGAVVFPPFSYWYGEILRMAASCFASRVREI